jgi:hypothetical protein
MIIQPGVEQPSVASMIELARTNSIRRVDIELQDSTGALVDIDATLTEGGEPSGALDLEITDVGGRVIYNESVWPPPLGIIEPRVKKSAPGKYYVDFGKAAHETDNSQAILFNWHSRQNATSEDVYRTQVVEVVSPRILSLLPHLRLLIDKTVKPNLPEKYCFIGYTDGMLVAFLKLGLHKINEYEPYPLFAKLDYFPIEEYSNILLRAALYQGITSQTLFSIDTDVPQFSDSGHSFVLQHATPLAAFLDRLRDELDKSVPNFKRKFVNSGTISVEMRVDMAFAMMLSSAPYGSLFRNTWAAM